MPHKDFATSVPSPLESLKSQTCRLLYAPRLGGQSLSNPVFYVRQEAMWRKCSIGQSVGFCDTPAVAGYFGGLSGGVACW